jgi:hypothetical protein
LGGTQSLIAETISVTNVRLINYILGEEMHLALERLSDHVGRGHPKMNASGRTLAGGREMKMID